MLWKRLSTQKQLQPKSPPKFNPLSSTSQTYYKNSQKNNCTQSSKDLDHPKFGYSSSQESQSEIFSNHFIQNGESYDKNTKNKKNIRDSNWTLGIKSTKMIQNNNKSEKQDQKGDVLSRSSSSEVISKICKKQGGNYDYVIEQIPQLDYEGQQNQMSSPQNNKDKTLSNFCNQILKGDVYDIKQHPSVSSYESPSKNVSKTAGRLFKPKSLGNLYTQPHKNSKNSKLKIREQEMNPSELQSKLQRQFPSYYEQKHEEEQEKQRSPILYDGNSQIFKNNCSVIHNVQKEDEPFEEFMRQMEEAGIDIANLDSKSYQNDNSQEALGFTEKIDLKNADRIGKIEKYQVSKNSSLAKKQSKTVSKFSNLKFKHMQEAVQQIKKLKHNNYKLNEDLLNLNLQMNKIIYNFQSQFKKIMIKPNQSSIIQQLKYQIVLLQQRLSQKQSHYLKQVMQTQDLLCQKEQLNLSIQQMKQKMIVVQQEKAKQRKQMIENNSQISIIKYQYQNQIIKLNDEVQELRKLSENYQEQYQNAFSKQRQLIEKQKQILSKKQFEITKRQNELERLNKKIKQDEKKISQSKQTLAQRQNKIENLQKGLQIKIGKIQKLEQELSEEFSYIEEMKNQYALVEQKLQKQRDNLIKQKKIIEVKIKAIQIQNRQAQELKILKKQSLPLHTDRQNKDYYSNIHNFRQSLYKNYNINEQQNYIENLQEKNKNQYQSYYFTDRYNSAQNSNRQKSRLLLSQKQQMKTTIGTNQDGNRVSQIYSKAQHFKNRSKFMSQVVQPFYKTSNLTPSISKQYKRYSQKGDLQVFRARSKSPKLTSLIKRSKSTNRLASDFKLNELDHKISMLRSEIQRQIGAAKQN